MIASEFNIEQLRERLRKMTDDGLKRFGRAASALCKDKGPRPELIIQLNEARDEWKRRHPSKDRKPFSKIWQLPRP
jgi:hypothetical protein